jgi:hypothetical protein
MKRNSYKYVHFFLCHRTLVIILLWLTFAFPAQSQVKIGDITTDPQPFSLLEIESVTGGVRLPQLTGTQANALKAYLTASTTPQTEKDRAQGLLIYNTDAKKLEMWNGKTKNWKHPDNVTDCVNAKSIAITAPVTVFTEYDASNDLVLTAGISGASPNAEPLYTWYRNDEPIATGPVLTVKKEGLTKKWEGSYTVDVLTCSFNAVGNLTSAPVNITVNQKYPIIPNSSTTGISADNNNRVSVTGHNIEFTLPVYQYLLQRNPGRSIEIYNEQNVAANRYQFVTLHHTAGISAAPFSLIYLDEMGNRLQSSPVNVPVINDFSNFTRTSVTLNGEAYTLYKPVSESLSTCVDVCRNLFFDHPRASLLSRAFLEKYAAYLSPSIIPAGDYWLLDKTFTPVKGTVSYPSGNFTLTTSDATSGNFSVRCIQPASN